ncbi:MAG: DUF4124 domain-containing protein [Halomonadaceae bacterium]|nr:MAG: DUF4124 domain-containing protein [Halomonadaceae bacterium]
MIKPGALALLVAVALLVLLAPRLFNHKETKATPERLPAFEDLVPLPRSALEENTPRMIYHWQDASGTQHYSDQAPSDYPSKALPLDDRVNRLPLVSQPREK